MKHQPWRPILVFCIAGFLLSSCAQKDSHHSIVISVPDQKLIIYTDSHPLAEYPVSTSKYGVGDHPGSYATPLGNLEVEKKFGDNIPAGGVLKSRRFTGETLAPDAPGRDPIVTRILWLRGLEFSNSNAYGRCIYIHGTPEESNIGKPASFGCIRMRSQDIINLYNVVGVGTKVRIINTPFEFPPDAQQQSENQWGG